MAVLEAETSAPLDELRAEARRAAEEARAAQASTERAKSGRLARPFRPSVRALVASICRLSPRRSPSTSPISCTAVAPSPPGNAAPRGDRCLHRRLASTRRPSTRSCAASIAGCGGARRRAEPKTALIDEGLHTVIAAIDAERLAGTRDRALLLVGFASALRRSELAVLEIEDLRFEADGMVVGLRRSKGHQESARVEVSILLGSMRRLARVASCSAGSSARRFSRGPSTHRTCGQPPPSEHPHSHPH